MRMEPEDLRLAHACADCRFTDEIVLDTAFE
jgi:hypothetical protein